MGFLKKLFGQGKSEQRQIANSPVCDVCNNPLDWDQAYVLTTKQVVLSQAYWEFAFRHQWSYVHGLDPEGAILAGLVQQASAQTTGWAVCESCSRLFNFDRTVARQYALQRMSHIPGSGSVDASAAAQPAAEVWKRLYGSYPQSIKVG
ncbi:MAG TPA: hypothetical protein VFQ13_11670 [Anaerolineales bacterium]|nr:hypothetical protein [Anaerolineales bacterium]